MALKKQIGPDTELYIKIRSAQTSKENPETALELLFSDRVISTGVVTYRIMAFHMCQGLSMTPEMLSQDGQNPWKAAYDWLKVNDPIFKHFEDC
jgi:hypothetical protein